jgi:pyruvate kinase
VYCYDVRQTKIVATIGPASSDRATIAALVEAGVNVFRLNFSHGNRDTHRTSIDTIRAVAGEAGRPVGILQDLSGPKIRTGELQGGAPITLAPGDPLEIRIGSLVGKPGLVSTTYAPLASAVKPGDRLLLDDGKIELSVETASSDAIRTRVVDGGQLGQHKGINAPNVPLPAAGVTAKDEADLRFGLSMGVDLVALSFVQSADDIARARAIAADANRPRVPIVAKLERPEAIERLTQVVEAADAVMVARGDLGLELPLERVPQVQKQVLRVARARGVPVIVATQVLESMTVEWRPTRAEVSDAAGAVDAGADAIMLSGETAVGAHPVRAVQVLDSIIRCAEAMPPPWTLHPAGNESSDHLSPLCDAAVTLAARGGADAILVITPSGDTAKLLSARRPGSPIVAVTETDEVARGLCLWWGVSAVIERATDDTEGAMVRLVATLRQRGNLPSPATVVVVSGSPDIDRKASNLVAIRIV